MSRNQMPDNENGGSQKSVGSSNDLMSLKELQRLCHIVKRPDFDGYGFNLHSEKGKSGQYIGKVDDNSPAEKAGLKEGDRIIEVNGADIGSETHKQVVQRIKAIACEVRLLVIDPTEEKEYMKREKTATSTTLPHISQVSNNNINNNNSNNHNNNNNNNNINNNSSSGLSNGTTTSTSTSTITIQSDQQQIANKDNNDTSLPTTAMPMKTKSVPSSSSSPKLSTVHTKTDSTDGDSKLNDNDDQKSNRNSNNSSISTSPSGVRSYQTNVQFIVNESQIQQSSTSASDDNKKHADESTIINNHHHNNDNNYKNVKTTTTNMTSTKQIITDDYDAANVDDETVTINIDDSKLFMKTENIRSSNSSSATASVPVAAATVTPTLTPQMDNGRSHMKSSTMEQQHSNLNKTLISQIESSTTSSTTTVSNASMGAVPKTTTTETTMKSSSSSSAAAAVNTNGNTNNNNNINNNNNNKKSSLNLPMTAAEMRAKLLAKKKYDPKTESVDLRKKFEIIQKL